MSEADQGTMGNAERREVTIALPAEMVDYLLAFCREHNVAPDRVVERALIEYFREGDVSH